MIKQEPVNSKPLGKRTWNVRLSPKKFIPKKLVRNDIGRNITVTRVSTFMMSLVRFEIAER